MKNPDAPKTSMRYGKKNGNFNSPSGLQKSSLRRLEAESIHIIREVAASFENPVMLYSVGKDSSVLVHLSKKAFFPGKIPFPLLHVDTGFKFKEMYAFRDRFVAALGAKLIVHSNKAAMKKKANPYDLGTQKCCALLKTQALVDVLRDMKFDAAFGGARRDEEKSRAKERIFSFRDKFGQWDPKNQRPELWNIYNTRLNKGESLRVFPLSNWTEIDVWQYIFLENIPVVPMYFAKKRDVLVRNKQLILFDSNTSLAKGEKPKKILCRFRTLGCYPCTGAIESSAKTVPEIIQEMLCSRVSERQNRLIDHDTEGSMEQKKREGYF